MTTATLGYEDLPGLMSLMTGDEKHSNAATSTLDVLWVLYDKVLRFDPLRPADPNRDRFLLSKGHGPMAFYAVLAAKGFFGTDWLSDWGSFDSPLGHHPDRNLIPGVEISSGSLGHGLALGVGMALALDAKGSASRVFCLLGDGELDEGANHEAIAFAGRIGLGRLTAIVIDNQSSTHGWPGGPEARFATEGWETARIDGHDHRALEQALAVDIGKSPTVVVATTRPRGT